MEHCLPIPRRHDRSRLQGSAEAGALQVCPQSAKVQLNSGILDRRHSRWDAALAHFEAARRIEPGYCEPAHWIGLTLLAHSSNNITGALSVRLPWLAPPL